MNAPAFRVLLPLHVEAPAMLPEGEPYKLAGRCMGTNWSVRVVIPSSHSAREVQARIAARLEEIEAQMSHFRSSSPLRRFAELAAGSWMELPPEFAQVMCAALDVAQRSGGAFDPTLGAHIDAWGFGAARRFDEAGFMPPTPAQQTHRPGWQQLQLDAAARLLQPGGLALNLAAIAKGFAVDAVSALLHDKGLPHHLVEVGGELRGCGMKPDGQPWWVALESPSADCPLPDTRVALHGLAVATSGNYRRYYLLDERLIQHTLDPHTGGPVAHGLASVTVLHEDCMLADAWATALMVLGPQAGLQLATKQGLRALLQWRNECGTWREATSPAFEALRA